MSQPDLGVDCFLGNLFLKQKIQNCKIDEVILESNIIFGMF
jgi:hypothetical protein